MPMGKEFLKKALWPIVFFIIGFMTGNVVSCEVLKSAGHEIAL